MANRQARETLLYVKDSAAIKKKKKAVDSAALWKRRICAEQRKKKTKEGDCTTLKLKHVKWQKKRTELTSQEKTKKNSSRVFRLHKKKKKQPQAKRKEESEKDMMIKEPRVAKVESAIDRHAKATSALPCHGADHWYNSIQWHATRCKSPIKKRLAFFFWHFLSAILSAC